MKVQALAARLLRRSHDAMARLRFDPFRWRFTLRARNPKERRAIYKNRSRQQGNVMLYRYFHANSVAQFAKIRDDRREFRRYFVRASP